MTTCRVCADRRGDFGREDNLEAAAAQLSSTLKWRASFKPEEAAKESFPPEVFDGLGFILPGRTKCVLSLSRPNSVLQG